MLLFIFKDDIKSSASKCLWEEPSLPIWTMRMYSKTPYNTQVTRMWLGRMWLEYHLLTWHLPSPPAQAAIRQNSSQAPLCWSYLCNVWNFSVPITTTAARTQGGIKCPKFSPGIPNKAAFYIVIALRIKMTLLIDLYMSNITSKILVKCVLQKPAKTQGHNGTSHFSAQM